ncbi:MAG: type III restriction-modification system endonuclease [Micrococcaceae bacterium]
MTNKELKINLVELPHQEAALADIVASFPEIDEISEKDANGIIASSPYANPLIKNAFNENKFIDIKMETGTGKTYVYTRMMYELHEKFGMFKFIVVVPSSAIKEGAKSFLTADYVRQHFNMLYPKVELNVGVINSGDFSSGKKRKEIPNKIREFVEAESTNKNQIQVLLLNDKGFLNREGTSLFKDDYDSTLMSVDTSPAKAIAKTRPVVIIDEPHKFDRKNKSYKNIIEKLKPEMIVRFGATFPEVSNGRGRNKVTSIDYYRQKPQHNLSAFESFSQGLVKGISVFHPELAGISLKDSYRVKSVKQKELVLEKDGKEHVVKANEVLSNIDSRFQGGLEYSGSKELSNGLALSNGMRLVPDVFTNTYQEILLNIALDRHFETERANFLREDGQVKTNALFFIDTIDAYRERETGKPTWLKDKFEELLKTKLSDLISAETDMEYKSFLEATLNDIANSHGGYFASDKAGSISNDKVAEEVDVILKNKARSLKLKDEKGKWNILRFFFSQWTLREGWDNPNVFTIAKLRSSGSEASKIQEVGRGLRLPVDVEGNRLADRDWWLNFVIDESEKDFVDKLLDEINEDIPEQIEENKPIALNIIEKLKEAKYGAARREITQKLYDSNIIDDDDNVIDVAALRLLLPLKTHPKVSRGKKETPKVKLKKENWNQIKEFWKEISKRYMVVLEDIRPEQLRELFADVINDDEIFNDNKSLTIKVSKVKNVLNDEGKLAISKTYGNVDNTATNGIGKLAYNKFLRLISKQTSLPVKFLHDELKIRLCKLDDINSKINEKTLAKIVDGWQAKFAQYYAQRYDYSPLDFTAKVSVMKNSNFVDEIAEGDVGTIAIDIDVDSRNLFEKILVDSENPEGEIARLNSPETVKVFGKIPRRAIQVPTYTGGTTTPDFVYVFNNDLYLLVEAKATSIRESEKSAVQAQAILFKKIKNLKWEMVQDKEQVHELLVKLAKGKSQE